MIRPRYATDADRHHHECLAKQNAELTDTLVQGIGAEINFHFLAGGEEMSELKIEKDIPIPDGANIRGRGKYPWHEIVPGDSFFVEGAKYASLKSAADAAKRSGKGHFVVRRVDGGARVWRKQ